MSRYNALVDRSGWQEEKYANRQRSVCRHVNILSDFGNVARLNCIYYILKMVIEGYPYLCLLPPPPPPRCLQECIYRSAYIRYTVREGLRLARGHYPSDQVSL